MVKNFVVDQHYATSDIFWRENKMRWSNFLMRLIRTNMIYAFEIDKKNR